MSNILFILIKIMLICNACIAMDFQRGDATIEVVSFKPRRISKRDLAYNNEHLANHNDDELIQLKVHAFNKSYDLNLKPLPNNRSIFGSNFIYNVIDFNDVDGEMHVQDITPSVEEIQSIEEQIYTDRKTGSFVTLKYSQDIANSDKDGKLSGTDITLNGMIHGGRIKRDVGNPHHVIELPSPFQQNSNIEYDYVHLNMTLTPRSGSGKIASDKKFTIYPELAIVADYKDRTRNYFGGGTSEEGVLQYIALHIARLADRYSLTDDPVIMIELVSVHVIKPGSVPPFIATLNSTTYNDIPHYDGIQLLYSFSDWAKANQDTIRGFGPNEHDLMALLTDRRSGDGGRGILGGVCGAGTSWATDSFGSLSGADALAHGIGHNLGATHDGEHEDTVVKCGMHHIMGGMTPGELNSLTFSPCSLQQIKAVALSWGGCMQVKGGPISKFEVTKHETNIQTAKDICEVRSSWVGYGLGGMHVYFQRPDDSCWKLNCWNFKWKSLINTGRPTNGEVCGIGGSGRCKNMYCLGDKPTTLDEICRDHTEDTSSFFVHPNTGSACAANIICNATLREPGYERNELVVIEAIPPSGTICGKNGEVCLDKTCTSNIRKPNGNCIVHTGTDTAVEEGETWDSAKECTSGTRCVFGTEYEWLKEPNNGHGCNDGDGECFEGKCIPKDGSLRLTVLDACKFVTRDNKATVNFNRFGERDVLCSKLSCRDAKGTIREATSSTPEGTVCGALKICKKGKCVYHLW